MPHTPPAIPDGNALHQRFAGLRRRIRFVATVHGIGWLLTTLLLALVVAGLLDWRFHLPALVRAVVLVGTLAGGGVIAYRYLIQPLSARTDDLTLALRVEERFPSLNDSLASTVQFLEQAEQGQVSSSDSAGLRREAVRRALGKATGCDFNRVVDSRGVRIAGSAGVVAAVLALTLTILFPSVALTALGRLANPFGSLQWPRKTKLELAEPAKRIGKEQAYHITGKTWGLVPDKATAEFIFDGFPSPVRKIVDVKKAADGTGKIEFLLKSHEVLRNFSFRVMAGDAETRTYHVQVLPPPTLVSLEGKPSPQAKLFYPRYTGLPSPRSLPPGTGNIDAVFGTVVELRAAADRPLTRAWIEYRPQPAGANIGACLAPLAATNVASALIAVAGSRSIWEPVPAALSPDGRVLTVRFQPIVHGAYALHLEDETGLRNQRQFELNLKADPRPTVRLVRPSSSRDILSVLPDAELPLEVVADDAEYALRSVYLEYRTRGAEPPRVLYLYRPDTGLAPALAPYAGSAMAAAPPLNLRPARLEFRQLLRIRDLRHADGAPLVEGDEVVLRARADDFDDVSVDKDPGTSEEIRIRIVGRQGLKLVINEEENKVQAALTELLAKEREVREKVAAIEQKLRRGEELTAEDRSQLLQAEQQQREEVRKKVGDEKEGLRAQVDRIREALAQNNQENTSASERLENVARELERLGERELAQVDPKLANARKMVEALAQAEQSEKEARDQERLAQKEREAAAQAEKQAAEAKDGATKAQRQNEAKAARRRAREAEAKAKQLREEAGRDKSETGAVPDRDKTHKAVTDVRKHQEEVEKTVAALLQDLEPARNTGELKREAVRLAQEQRRLQRELEEMAKLEKLAGKNFEELTKEQKAELEALAEKQERMQERTNQLLDKMGKVAEKLAEKDRETGQPRDAETAKALREALAKLEGEDIPGKMKEAASNIKDNKLNEAQKNQRQAREQLDKMVRNLEDRRAEELDQLIKKLREAEKMAEELTDEQEELQKKLRAAEQIKDAGKREAEMKRLARRQAELKQKTEELVKQLSRLRSERARKALNQANEEMAQAEQQLTRGKADDDKQEDALDRLDEARDELKRARRRAEEQLGREQLEKLADQLKRYKERQEGHNKEAERIQREVRQAESWTRGLRSSLRALAENQGWGEKRAGDGEDDPDKLKGQLTGLAQESGETARKQLSGTPVFARQMQRTAEAMEKAGRRLHQMTKAPPDLAALPDEETARYQAQALRRLDQLLEAIKDAQQGPQPINKGGGGKNQEGEGGGEDGGGANRRPDDSLPPLAQLRLLRKMQQEVNERTEAFHKKHPDLNKVGAKEKAELEEVRREQKDVADLLEELTRPVGEAKKGGNE